MSDKVASGKGTWPGWVWVERAVWVLVLVIVIRRFGPQIAATVSVGDDLGALPDVELVTVQGDTLRSADLAGKVVLVNFWATWCPPCRVEMPGFERVYQDLKDDGFVVVGLSTDRLPPEEVAAFAVERGVTYPIALSPPGLGAQFGGVDGLPTSFLVDRGGQIRHRVFGYYASPTLRLAVQRMLKEPTGN